MAYGENTQLLPLNNDHLLTILIRKLMYKSITHYCLPSALCHNTFQCVGCTRQECQKEMANSCDFNNNQTILDLTYATDLSGFVFISWEWTLYQIILPCMIAFGICTNISFIWTVINTPSLHTNTYRYLVNLAITDLLFLMTNYISQIVYYHQSPLIRNLPTVVRIFVFFFTGCSFGTVTLVSLERFLAICYPIKHHLIKGTRRTNKLICSVWCISLCYALPLLLVSKTSNMCIIWPDGSAYADYPSQYTTSGLIDNWISNLVTFVYYAFYFFLIIFNNVLYFKIYFALRRRNNNDLGLNSTSDSQHRQVAYMLIVNGIFFFICVSFSLFASPVFLFYSKVTNGRNPLLVFIWSILTNILFGLNASMNPVLYLITNKKYRHEFITIFTWSRNNSQHETGVNTIELSKINRI